jgi:hypothetical protein
MRAGLAIHRYRAQMPATAEPVVARLALQALAAELDDALPRSLPPQALLWLRRAAIQVAPVALKRVGAGRDQVAAQGREQLDAALSRAVRLALGPVPSDAEAVLFADEAEMLACLALAAQAGQLDRWWWRGLLGSRWPAWPVAWAQRPAAQAGARRLLARVGMAVAAPGEGGGPVAEAVAARSLAVSLPPEDGRAAAGGDAPGQTGVRPGRPVAVALLREVDVQALERAAAIPHAPDPAPRRHVVEPPSSRAAPEHGGNAARMVQGRQPGDAGSAAHRLAPPRAGDEARGRAAAVQSAVPEALPRLARAIGKASLPPVTADPKPQLTAEPAPPLAVPLEDPAVALPADGEPVADARPAEGGGRAQADAAGPMPSTTTPPRRGAALPADSLAPVEVEAEPPAWPWPEAQASHQGALLFLVNGLLEDGLYPDFTRPLDPGLPVPMAALLVALALVWRLPPDPLQALLAAQSGHWQPDRLTGDLPGAPGVAPGPWSDWLPAYARSLRRRLSRRLGMPARQWRAALHRARPCRVWVSVAAWEVVFELADHDVAWRLAGLDRDPGWLPSADLSLRFRFT